MASKLVADTLKGTYIEKINVFEPSGSGEIWECPFCDTAASTAYKLYIPPKNDSEKLKEVKMLIKNHVELHRKDIRERASIQKGVNYKQATEDSIRRVRLWIEGTVKDRKLYENKPED